MAKYESIRPKDKEISNFEDAFDDAFGAYMQQPCDWNRICLTQIGWFAKIKFGDQSPFDQKTEAAADLETLKFWEDQGYFTVEEDRNADSVTLKYKSGVKEDYFPADVTDLLNKYSVEASAYPNSLHAETSEITHETAQKAGEALDWQEASLDLEALTAFNFTSIVVVLPPYMKEILGQAVKAFQDLCEEEELEFKQEHDEWGITIILSKRKDIEYHGSMEPAYAQLFQKLAGLEGVEVVVE